MSLLQDAVEQYWFVLWRIRMGEVACAEEIKAFIAKHNIKQQQIASLAGKCFLHLCQKSCWFSCIVQHLMLQEFWFDPAGLIG